MKAIRVLTLYLVLIALLSACAPCSGEPPACKEMPEGCSVFTVAKGDRVFFGGNDDYIELDSYYWVEPGKGDDYGVVWIGTPDNVQQGVNEMGLAYDANSLPEVSMNVHRERTPWPGHMGSAQMHILHECATVEEVIAWVQTHQVWPQMNDQRQFADASGDAVLISPGPDGELVFTRKPRGEGYLVSTNFNVIHPEHGYGYPCWRYETAQGMLGDLVAGREALTVKDAAGVLEAVHVEGGISWTRSSLVADLPNGLIYLYYFYQFDKPLVLSVADELANPRAPGPLSALFPEDVQQEAQRRYGTIQAGLQRCRGIGMAWIAGVIGCTLLLVVLSPGGRLGRKDPPGMHFWIVLVLVLGPLGFLVWLIAGRKGRRNETSEVADGEGGPSPKGPILGRWRAALLEAAGDVLPAAVAFAVFMALALSVPAVMGSELTQLALILGLPVALGWLVFQGLLLARAARLGYLQTLWQRLPHALIAANLGLAGMHTLATPLINVSLRTCAVFPQIGWEVGTLWAIVAGGALLGGLLLLLYHSWAVRRGLSAWTVVAWGDGEVRSGSWRALWWWVLLSYLVCVGGVAASALLQQWLAA